MWTTAINIRTGKGFYANHNLVILDGAPVTFGDHVFIGPNCCFSTAGHPLDAPSATPGWNTPSRSRSAAMSGSAWACRCCRA